MFGENRRDNPALELVERIVQVVGIEKPTIEVCDGVSGREIFRSHDEKILNMKLGEKINNPRVLEILEEALTDVNQEHARIPGV